MSSKVIYTVAVASIVLLGLAMLANSQAYNNNNKLVTDVCLGCICEAISGCNQTQVCTGGVCGLFRITWAYWADGGKLTLNNEPATTETAYPNCVNDPYCAANTIQNYMAKFGQDCNGDGTIDCYDYAAIHKLGGYGCSGDLSGNYATTLNRCLATFG